MGCNCKTLKNKKDLEEFYENGIGISNSLSNKIKLIITFIILVPFFAIGSFINFLIHGKKLQNKG